MLFLKKKKVQIISLGQNCIPRTVLTRYGLKPRKFQGELTYPFDLAVMGVMEVTKSLKTDFAEFLYDLNYKLTPSGYIWVKEPDCIFFVHDKRFNQNNKDKLIKTYLKRINNFRRQMLLPEPVLFVQIIDKYEDILNLYNELLKLRGDNPFALAVIDTQDVVKNIDKKGIHILKLPFPSADYENNWWKKQYYSSCEGVSFEKKIGDFCSKIIDTELNCPNNF